jgi:hypothetical protein
MRYTTGQHDMTTDTSAEDVAKARSRLIEQWDELGACRSCGWHALLSEHDVSDSDIADALKGGGILKLSCLSKDQDGSDHKGISIFMGNRHEP